MRASIMLNSSESMSAICSASSRDPKPSSCRPVNIAAPEFAIGAFKPSHRTTLIQTPEFSTNGLLMSARE